MGQLVTRVREYFRNNGASASTISIISNLGRQWETKSDEQAPKVYSWTNRKPVNADDFKFVGIESKVLVKQPGSINGQQFIIENCRNCTIFLMDWSDSVSILGCTGCAVFVGPCKGSFFLRNATDCTVAVICQQFRTRDCRRITAFICCGTQPIIESTVDAKFGCLQVSYPNLEDQIFCAGLSPFDNNWSDIHDFTPSMTDEMMGSTENHMLLRDPDATARVGLSDPETLGDTEVLINFDPGNSVIPFTHGLDETVNEKCLVAFFIGRSMHSQVHRFCNELQTSSSKSLKLLHSKQMVLSESDSIRLDIRPASSSIFNGEVVLLIFGGAQAVADCQSAVARSSLSTRAFVSPSTASAATLIESLWNLSDMTMN